MEGILGKGAGWFHEFALPAHSLPAPFPRVDPGKPFSQGSREAGGPKLCTQPFIGPWGAVEGFFTRGDLGVWVWQVLWGGCRRCKKLQPVAGGFKPQRVPSRTVPEPNRLGTFETNLGSELFRVRFET